MYDAFISYRREYGYLMAELLRKSLLAEGINCYLDLEEDRSGEINEKIFDAIEESQNFIIVLTKGTLERCVNEGDFVRTEIGQAVSLNKNIIPVRYPDFEWPKEINEQLPFEVLEVEKKQFITLRQEYLDATVKKIKSYMIGVAPLENKQKNSGIPNKTSEFFINGLEKLSDIQCVDMAFHGGAEWHRDSEKVDILTNIIEKNITLRVLVNSSDTVSSVCSHMSQPLKKYVGFDDCVNDWVQLANAYPDVVQVHIAEVPLLHRVYIIRDEKKGFVNTKYYTYGNYRPEKDFRMVFDDSGMEYKLYTEEFDYIWNNASHGITEQSNF